MKINPHTRLDINISSLRSLKLPNIQIYIPDKKDEPECPKIVYVEKKIKTNNEELF